MANDITDPTGGAPNFNIYDIFQSFGYTPTQAEINAIAPSFEGRTNVGETGMSAVANYVQAHQQINGAQSLVQGNLKSETDAAQTAQTLAGQYAGQGASSYDQELQTLQSAPKLFGSLTPDQVSQYLAPLQTQFNYGLGQVQGAAAQRGLAGSSLEAQAMAQAQAQYQQNVLSQGLSLGLNNQSLLANAYASLGSQQYGLAQQQYGLGPQYYSLANSSAGQNVGLSEDMAQLPGQAVNQALAQQATIQAMNPKSSSPLGGYLGTGLGFLVGGPIGAQIGGNIASSVTGNPAGAQIGQAVNPFGGFMGLNQGSNYSNPMAQYPGLMNMFGGSSASPYTSGLSFPQGSPSMTSGLPSGYAGGYSPGSTLLPAALSLAA